MAEALDLKLHGTVRVRMQPGFRLTLPPAWMAAFPDSLGVVALVPLHPQWQLYPAQVWEKRSNAFLERCIASPPHDLRTARALAQLIGSGEKVKIDRLRRFVIPPKLRTYGLHPVVAQPPRLASLVGCGHFIRILP